MQGEKIGEQSGKVTSQRVLPNPGGPPKMEISFQANTTLLGVRALFARHLGIPPMRPGAIPRLAYRHATLQPPSILAVGSNGNVLMGVRDSSNGMESEWF
jgi:hypothetical protein